MSKKIILFLSAMLIVVSLFAYACGPKSISVKFDANGGTLVSGEVEQVVDDVSKIQEPVFTREGYTFGGLDTVLSHIKSDTIVKALWVPNVYTVTFNLNDSAEFPATMSGQAVREYVYDSAMALPVPERNGFIFTGWKLGSELGTELVNGSAVKILDDATAYATWIVDDSKTYTITYDLGGGSLGVGLSNPTTYKYTDASITLKNPTKDGCVFLGWLEDNNQTPVKVVTIPSGSIGDKKFVACWGVAKYNIVFNLQYMSGDGKLIEVKVNGSNSYPSKVISSGESLGVYLPGVNECKVPSPYNEDWTFYYWECNVNGTKIRVNKDYVFTTEVFGEAGTSITLNVVLGPMYGSGPH